MKNDSKVAIITGASSGIGEATALKLAKNGVSIVLAARRKTRLEHLKEEIEQTGGNALVVPTDVTKRQEVQDLVKKTLDHYGKIDILINNAGIMPLSYLKNTHVAEWERMIDVNLKGVIYCIAEVLPVMRRSQSGHIINISSAAGRRVFEGGAVYCATKFAVGALSEGLRMELAPTENIRVTCIEPGGTNTELARGITDEEYKNARSARWKDVVMLQPKDVAESICYAISQPLHVNVSEILVLPTMQKV